MMVFRRLVWAGRGWGAIMRGDAGWQRHFLICRRGLIEAVALYLVAAYLVSHAGSAGILHWSGVVIASLMLLVYPAALCLAVMLTLPVLGRPRRMLFELMVPGVYALIVFVLFTGIGQLVYGPIIMVGLIGIGIAMGRFGMVSLRGGLATGAAFGVLVTVLLVGLPFSLYMLASLSSILA